MEAVLDLIKLKTEVKYIKVKYPLFSSKLT